MTANTSHAGPLPVDKPRRGGGILEWCLKAQDGIRRNRPIAGNGLLASSTPNGIVLTIPDPVEPPTALKQSRPPYVDDGIGYVDMYNGQIFWGDDWFPVGSGSALGGTTPVELSAGTNHVYANLPWSETGPVATFEAQSSWPIIPTESNYKVHLASYYVHLAAPSARLIFIAWNGGDIHIPSAYASA